jgi:hypothetical protein
MYELKVKHIIGDRPEGMATDFMTKEDWQNYDAYVERCKRNKTYGKEIEITIILKDPLFFNNQGCILDLRDIKTHSFKPLNPFEDD